MVDALLSTAYFDVSITSLFRFSHTNRLSIQAIDRTVFSNPITTAPGDLQCLIAFTYFFGHIGGYTPSVPPLKQNRKQQESNLQRCYPGRGSSSVPSPIGLYFQMAECVGVEPTGAFAHRDWLATSCWDRPTSRSMKSDHQGLEPSTLAGLSVFQTERATLLTM